MAHLHHLTVHKDQFALDWFRLWAQWVFAPAD